jgi:hypothetical protein
MVDKITTEDIYRKEIAELSKQNHELMIRVKDLLEEINELKNPKVSPCRAHAIESEWEENNERIDIIGQNGNDGLHYGIDDTE